MDEQQILSKVTMQDLRDPNSELGQKAQQILKEKYERLNEIEQEDKIPHLDGAEKKEVYKNIVESMYISLRSRNCDEEELRNERKKIYDYVNIMFN